MATDSEAGERARAFRIRRPGEGDIVDVDLPARGADGVRVRTLYTAISRGSEGLVWRGEVPASQHEVMRAPFQQGDFPGPVIYGYSNVGRVEAGPAELRGRVVFALYPHQTEYVVPAHAVVPVPEAVPPERAVLAANMETAVNALWDAGPRVGDRIAVVGGGVVGCLVAALCARIPGVALELIDTDPGRAPIAAALGAAFRAPDAARGDCDVVFHASGNPAGARRALALAGHEARVVELSWFGTRAVALALGEAFHSRRLSLRGSQVGTVAPARSPRWSHRDRLALALRLLAEPVFAELIGDAGRFDELPAIMARVAAGEERSLCPRIRYESGASPWR